MFASPVISLSIPIVVFFPLLSLLLQLGVIFPT